MRCVLAAWVWFPGTESHHSSVSRAVVVAHVEELEGHTARIYSYALGLWGEKKRKRGRLATDIRANLSQEKKKRNVQNVFHFIEVFAHMPLLKEAFSDHSSQNCNPSLSVLLLYFVFFSYPFHGTLYTYSFGLLSFFLTRT